MNSTHKAEVVPVVLMPHNNADSLSVVRVHDYQVVVRTELWKERTKGVYCPPDSIIPAGLVDGIEGRVKAIKLRGIWSEGLLIPCETKYEIGQDVTEELGIGHWDPPADFIIGDNVSPPIGHIPSYDLEAARRWSDKVFKPFERVIATEKIHGANGRFTYRDGQIFAGSKANWKAGSDEHSRQSMWWAALAQHPEISAWCEQHPNQVLYGEVYGKVQSLRYGLSGVRIILFDIWDGTRYLTHDESRNIGPELPWVPVLYDGPWTSLMELSHLADGKSTMPNCNHIREGCVFKAADERYDMIAGRSALKLIGREYLSLK